MEDFKDFNKFDNKVLDIDEVGATDIKINPDFYIHNALVKAQQSLVRDDVKAGYAAYRIYVEQVELLCRAANMLPDNYDENIKTFKLSEEYMQSSDYKMILLANKKLELVMTEVFKSKLMTEPLKA